MKLKMPPPFISLSVVLLGSSEIFSNRHLLNIGLVNLGKRESPYQNSELWGKQYISIFESPGTPFRIILTHYKEKCISVGTSFPMIDPSLKGWMENNTQVVENARLIHSPSGEFKTEVRTDGDFYYSIRSSETTYNITTTKKL